MKRKDFIRNTLLGFASLLLPEVLRPMDGVVVDEFSEAMKMQLAELNKYRPAPEWMSKFGYYSSASQTIGYFEGRNGKWKLIREETFHPTKTL